MPKRTPGFIVRLALFVLVYLAAGALIIRLPFLHDTVSVLWPPTWIAIACVLLMGNATLPAIFLGAFLVHVTYEGFLPSSLVIALENTLEVFIAGYLIRRFARSTSEKRLRALTEKSADAITLIDTHGIILSSSHSARHIIGYAPEKLKARDWFSLVDPLDLDRAKKTLDDILKSPDQSHTIELRLKRNDDTFVWVELNGTNRMSDPNVAAVVINYRDITERRQLDEAKSEFLRLAAHQLRSPLSTMRWTMELLQKPSTKVSSSVRQKLNTVYDHILQMITLVNELLDVTAIIQGDIREKPQSTVVSDIVEKVVKDLEPDISKKGLSVRIRQAGSSLPHLWIDQKRFENVIENLLSNAVKYNHTGGTVTIDLFSRNSRFIIQVTDSGLGIPKEDANRIFTKFFRAPNAMASEVDGAGLGLFVVKSYIEKWGGTVSFTSPVDLDSKGGTRFIISLPLLFEKES
jgi:PAS domain S-box-containing protein